MIARCPPDSSSTAPIDRGRPAQLVSSTVVLNIAPIVYREFVSETWNHTAYGHLHLYLLDDSLEKLPL